MFGTTEEDEEGRDWLAVSNVGYCSECVIEISRAPLLEEKTKSKPTKMIETTTPTRFVP